MRYTWLAGLVLGSLPVMASAHEHGHSGFSFGLNIGVPLFGGYSSYDRYCGPTYYEAPVRYYSPPVTYYSAPAYVDPPVTYYSEPVYVAPPVTYYAPPPVIVYSDRYYDRGCYSGGHYGHYYSDRPRYFHYDHR